MEPVWAARVKHGRLAAGFAVVALIGSACASDGDDDVQARTYDNVGRACMLNQVGRPNVLADQPALVRVVMDDCQSYCATVEEASCEASLEEGVIRVTSHATVRRVIDGAPCPDACLAVSATCGVGSLPEGTYRLDHGDGYSQTVQVPGSNPCER